MTAWPADRGADADRLAPGAGDALLVVDLQRDFLPGGAAAVRGGDAVVAPANACMARFAARHLPVFASRDWHPPGHVSFRDAGGTWPAHCIAGTAGATFAGGLEQPPGVLLVSKGTRPERDASSAFDGTDLATRLRARGVRRLFVAGLGTDRCVLHSVLDALDLGYRVVLLTDAVAALDAQPGDGRRAVERMLAAGAVGARTADLH